MTIRRSHLLDRPAATPQTRLFTNPTDPAYNSDFQTVEFAINRRFAEQLDVADLVRLHLAGSVPRRGNRHRRPRRAVARPRVYNWRANQRLFGDDGKETSTLWNYKIDRPLHAALRDWLLGLVEGAERPATGAGHTSVTFPGDGAQNIRMEPVTANRAPTVAILDFRADKSFTFGRFRQVHRHGRRLQRDSTPAR